jgi:hypothetical protein
MRGVFMALAVVALAVRAATPAGFMLADTGDGVGRIVICTGDGPLLVAAPGTVPHDAPTTPDESGTEHNPCAFAGMAQAAPGPDLLAVEAIAFPDFEAPAVRPLAHLAPGRGLAAPPLPARGPPNLLI